VDAFGVLRQENLIVLANLPCGGLLLLIYGLIFSVDPNYYPDFIVKTSERQYWIVETKGQQDLDVPLKMERLKQWCHDIKTIQHKAHFDYVFVDEEGFNKYKPVSFTELVNIFTGYKQQL
jgi:hypothetical protein